MADGSVTSGKRGLRFWEAKLLSLLGTDQLNLPELLGHKKYLLGFFFMELEYGEQILDKWLFT